MSLLTKAVIFARVPSILKQRELFMQIEILEKFSQKFELPVEKKFTYVETPLERQFKQIENYVDKHTILIHDRSLLGFNYLNFLQNIHKTGSNLYTLQENRFSTNNNFYDIILPYGLNDDEKRIVEIIISLFNDGMSCNEIAEVLNVFYGNRNRGQYWTELAVLKIVEEN
jgi:hypothetical protein